MVNISRKTKKTTFNLPSNVLDDLDRAMLDGQRLARMLVERAPVKEMKELQRQARKARWEEGAKDSALLTGGSEDYLNWIDEETRDKAVGLQYSSHFP